MNITVFGANGKVGRQVVDLALHAGHHVTAFVHNENPFDESPQLDVISGDIYNQQDVERAVRNSRAVISALGSWGTPNKDILSSGMKNIIPAMQKYKVERIVSLTGNVAKEPGETFPFTASIARKLLGVTAKKVIKDGEEHIRLLQQSNLDWTVMRSSVMTESGRSGYSLRLRPLLFGTIHRSAVAKALLAQIESNEFLRKSPFIVRAK
jgi:putative NADH-flavin reductase